MLVSFARTTITVVRAGTVVDHGTTVKDWSNPTLIPVPGCLIDTQAGLRDTVHRDGERTDLVVLAPPGSDITADDRIRVPGYADDFMITDGPRAQPSPTGRLAHIQMTLQVWEG